MEECIFCKIIKGEIPTNIIYQDDQVIAFDDLYPKAPIHKLIVPRKHIATLNDLTPAHKELVGHMVYTATQLAKKLKDHGVKMIFDRGIPPFSSKLIVFSFNFTFFL